MTNGSKNYTECKEICGDKLIVGNETCDDGVDKDNKGCADGCKSGSNPLWTCINSGDFSTCVPICGDGFQIEDEVCDSGDKEGCVDCKSILDGWVCSNGDSTKPSICSKGLIAVSEGLVSSAVTTS